MIRFFKNVTALMVFAAITAQGAVAQTPQFYIGVHGGKSIAASELTLDMAPVSIDGLSSNGYVGGVHAGLDLQLPNSPLFFGVLAGYSFQNTEFNAAFGSSTFSATLGNTWYAGGRVGFVIYGAKVYGLAAYRQAEWDSTVAELTSPDLKGFDLGMGIDIPIAKNVSLGLEVVNTHFRASEFQLSGVDTGVSQQVDQLVGMARLNFTLGGANPLSVFDDRRDPPAEPRGADKKVLK
jgi:opacity protein-like surface antigen